MNDEPDEEHVTGLVDQMERVRFGPSAYDPESVVWEDEVHLRYMMRDHAFGKLHHMAGRLPWGIDLLALKWRKDLRDARFRKALDAC